MKISPPLLAFLGSRLLIVMLTFGAALGLPTFQEKTGSPQPEWDFLRIFLTSPPGPEGGWTLPQEGLIPARMLVVFALQVPVLASFYALWQLFEPWGPALRRRALLYFAFFPAGVWLLLPNTDGLLLGLALLAFLRIRQGRGGEAWLWATLACALRPAGAFLALALGASPAGRRGWPLGVVLALLALANSWSPAVPTLASLWVLPALPLALVSRRLGVEFALYSALLTIAPSLLGWPYPERYLAQAFPLCMGMASLGERFEELYLPLSGTALCLWILTWARPA